MKNQLTAASLRIVLSLIVWGLFSVTARGQDYIMTNLWAIHAGANNWLSSSGYTERGMAYNPATGHVLVVSRASGNKIVVINGTDGSSNNVLDLSGIYTSGPSINFALNKIGVAADGVIYACDLTAPAASTTNNFIVYRWATESSAPTVAFQGSLANLGTRFGDSFAVTGSGTNTMMAAGVYTGISIGVLTTTDGVTFTATSITNSGASMGDFQPGLDFYGATNLFSRHTGVNLFHFCGFNLNSAPPSFHELTSDYFSPIGYGPLKVLAASNWLFSLQTTVDPNGTGHYVSLFSISTNAPAGTLTYLTSNAIVATSGSGNGNLTGEVAASGSNVFVLDTDNALEAFAVLPATPVVPPSAIVSPSAQTEYAGNPGFSFTASATGTTPISFQWYAATNGVTNQIAGATNSSYSFGVATTNMSGNYFVVVSNAGGSSPSAPVTLTVQTPFTTGRLSNLWNILPGGRFYMDDSSGAQCGLAYDSTNGDLLIASSSPTNLIAVVNGITGTDQWLMNVDPSVINSANVTDPLNVIGVGDDGVVYGVPLVSPGNTGFALYAWSNDGPSSVPEKAFTGDPGGGTLQRWGDSLAVIGAGGNTKILLPSGSATNQICIFTSSDGGHSFTPTILSVIDPDNPNLVGFAQLGVAWANNNTFWTKSTNYNLRQIQYDLTAHTATVVGNYNAPTQGLQAAAIGIGRSADLLAMLSFDAPPSVRLYDIWYSTQNYGMDPVMVDQQLFTVNNANSNCTGGIAFSAPYIYVLDSNNGIEAYKADTNALAPFIVQPPQLIGGSDTKISFNSQSGHAYQVQTKPTLSAAWVNDGTPFASTGTASSFTDTNPPLTANFFRVIGH